MYAIVEIAGKQYKVQEKDKLFVPHLDAKVDDTIEFDRVLLVASDGDVTVGSPLVENAAISATVLEHVKADKILVFRKIRRKRFKVTKGHRQRYTRIEVSDVLVNGASKKKKSKTTKPSESAVSPTEAEAAKTDEAKADAADAKKTKAAEAKAAEAKAAEKESVESKEAEADAADTEAAAAADAEEAKSEAVDKSNKEAGDAEAESAQVGDQSDAAEASEKAPDENEEADEKKG